MQPQPLEFVCRGWGRTEVVLGHECDHFGGDIEPGIPLVRPVPVPGLVLLAEPELTGFVVVEEEGQTVVEFGQWC